MSIISEAASLSRHYTNHSLRANHVHMRDKERVHTCSRHIMSLALHKFKYFWKQTTESTYAKYLMLEAWNTRSWVVSLHSKSEASSTITKAMFTTNANFDIGFPPLKPCSTCDDEATLNDSWNNINANINANCLPVLPTMRCCSNVTITHNIRFNN